MVELEEALAAESEFVAFELGIFAGLTEESHNTDQDLDGDEYDPDVHALIKAWTSPNQLHR